MPALRLLRFDSAHVAIAFSPVTVPQRKPMFPLALWVAR